MALEGKFAGERVCPDWRSGRQAIWTMLEEGMKREIGEPVVHIGDAELWNSSRSGQLLRCGLDGLATYRRILSSRQAIQDPPVLSLTALYRIKPREAIKSSVILASWVRSNTDIASKETPWQGGEAKFKEKMVGKKTRSRGTQSRVE